MLFWRNKKPSYRRALAWCRAHTVPGQGVVQTLQGVASNQVLRLREPVGP